MTDLPTASLGVTSDMPRRSVALPQAGPAVSATTPATAENPAPPGHHGLSFHDILSSLNPLQYIPVVGTIYRAVTGDEIPESTRMAGSFVVGGLTAGPFGVATSVASTIFEKMTGIDPERVGRSLLASLGIGNPPPPAADPAAAKPTQLADNSMIDPAAPIDLTCGSQDAVPVPISRVQATAYAAVVPRQDAIALADIAPPSAALTAAYQRLEKPESRTIG